MDKIVFYFKVWLWAWIFDMLRGLNIIPVIKVALCSLINREASPPTLWCNDTKMWPLFTTGNPLAFIFSPSLPHISPLCRQLITKGILTPNWRGFHAPTSVSKHWAHCQWRPPPLLPTYATQTRGDCSATTQFYMHDWLTFEVILTDTPALVQWPGSININTWLRC